MPDVKHSEPEYATDEILDWRKDMSLKLVGSDYTGEIADLIRALEPVVFNPHKHTGK